MLDGLHETVVNISGSLVKHTACSITLAARHNIIMRRVTLIYIFSARESTAYSPTVPFLVGQS